MNRFEYKFASRVFHVPYDMPAEKQIANREAWMNELGQQGWKFLQDYTPSRQGAEQHEVRILMMREIDG